MASDFKKTHQVRGSDRREVADTWVQDTWHSDKFAFTEDELQALNTILVGTSYCESLHAERPLFLTKL